MLFGAGTRVNSRFQHIHRPYYRCDEIQKERGREYVGLGTESVEQFAERVLEEADRYGVSYADVRVMRGRAEDIRARDGVIEGVATREDEGFGVRVLLDGAWGFAAHPGHDTDDIRVVVAAAVEAARAAASINTRRVDLVQTVPPTGTYHTTLDRDPFAVSVAEKLELILAMDAAVRGGEGVAVSRSHLLSFATDKVFQSTEGARLRQEVTECGGGVLALATGGGKPARRSYANYAQGGWEYVEGLKLPLEAQRVGQEAALLLAAPYVEPGLTDVVLGSSQLALMVHETCGHPTELDRVLGFEDAFAGGSFLQPEERGHLAYGSPQVNLTADSTMSGGLGTFGWDDDGVPAQRFPLVRDGIFQGYLSNRETAPLIGLERSTGCSRADGWGRMPIVRMVNVSLEPGDVPFEDLIGGVEDGLYLDTPSSWSLDDKRLNFHFGLEFGREIKNGQLGRVVRGATLQDITPRFWGRCDGVGEPSTWTLWGLLSCAKGEPLQSLHVGHGAAPARFRGITVGVEQ